MQGQEIRKRKKRRSACSSPPLRVMLIDPHGHICGQVSPCKVLSTTCSSSSSEIVVYSGTWLASLSPDTFFHLSLSSCVVSISCPHQRPANPPEQSASAKISSSTSSSPYVVTSQVTAITSTYKTFETTQVVTEHLNGLSVTAWSLMIPRS